MRWYGPDIALTYDWLYSAPGVTSALLAQTRVCLTAWNDFYTASGYHNNQAGSNYNAGYVIAKTLGGIAIGTDGGADGHLWNETVNTLFTQLLVNTGLAGVSLPVGQPAGAMAGGDWLEGWQYGPLSVLEYAVAARAVEANGMPLPALEAWTNSLAVRYIYGTVPTMDGQWVGGDLYSTQVYQSPSVNEVDAVLVGPSSDQAAAWAAFMKMQQAVGAGAFVYNAMAELRSVAPQDYRLQSPPPSTWYLARGSRAMYVRTSWAPTAFWGVFSSPPHIVDDHEHFAAGDFVFSRGADHLIVDSSNYGENATFETNAIAGDANLVADYTPSQTPWSGAELRWARGTIRRAFAARADFAQAFAWAGGTASAIPYALRDWVLLPEGETITIDRMQTADAAHVAYLHFHANTGGAMKRTADGASGKVGGSMLVIHAMNVSGGTPTITQPSMSSCTISCNYPCGLCDTARFLVDEYAIKVPGPWAVAIHVFDALGAGETATVGSLNDDDNDPAPKQNAGVIGAAISRAAKRSYVVASSAVAGAIGATLTYAVPGDSPARHIVFDAPEGPGGFSTVTATAQSGRCVIAIVASAAAGFVGHPLMFQVASAASGCLATDGTAVPSASPPPTRPFDAGATGNDDAAAPAADAGAGATSSGSSASSTSGTIGTPTPGCALGHGNRYYGPFVILLLLAIGLLWRRSAQR